MISGALALPCLLPTVPGLSRRHPPSHWGGFLFPAGLRCPLLAPVLHSSWARLGLGCHLTHPWRCDLRLPLTRGWGTGGIPEGPFLDTTPTHTHRRCSGETRRWMLTLSMTASGLPSGTSTSLRSVVEGQGCSALLSPLSPRSLLSLTKELPPVLAPGHLGQLGHPNPFPSVCPSLQAP